MAFSFTAFFNDKSLHFEERCKLTRMSVQYIKILNKVLVDHSDEIWNKGELMTLRSEIEEVKRVAVRILASNCSTGLYSIKFHPWNHLMEELQELETIYFTDATPYEHFNVLTKHSYSVTFRHLSMLLQ